MPHASTPPQLLIFDDARGDFGPLTDRRATFDLRAGVLPNRVRIETALGQMACALVVRPQLVEVVRARQTDALVNAPLRRGSSIAFHVQHSPSDWRTTTVAGDSPVLLVNGRWPGDATIDATELKSLPLGHALVQPDGQVVAAHLEIDAAQRFVDGGCVTLPADVKRRGLPDAVLLERPWDLLNRAEKIIPHDLGTFTQSIAPGARVHPTVVCDEAKGRVVIDADAVVGAHCVLEGPCHVGRAAVLAPLTYLRPGTVIGEGCKVAGEVSASLVLAFTNKAHYGYLGNSIVGEWCNLGAGTVVSNLKNTYGPVRMQLRADGPAEATGRMFLGPLIGDFVRTAIGSRILTGSCIGTASMLAVSGFSPKFVGTGRFVTDDGDEAVEPDKLVATARAMFARRNMQISPAEVTLLRSIVSR